MTDMKTALFIVFALIAPVVLGMEIPALPPPEYADTEASTNFVFAVGEGGGRRLVFSLELEAGTTNNVEVAIGCDADCDGRLSLDETALAVGYDCRTWFVRSAAKDCVTISNAAVSGTFRRTYEVRSRHIDPAWNLVKVTRRGLGASNENVLFKLVEFGFGVKIW